MGKNLKTYGNLLVTNTGITNFLSANTISGGLLLGNINAQFIGSGTSLTNISNFVNNNEFIRMSGLTGFVQTQLNSKAYNYLPYLTFTGSNLISNSRIMSAGTNINYVTGSTTISVNQKIGALEFGAVRLSTSGDTNYSVNDLNLSGWNDSFPNSAFHIKIEPLCVIKLGGVVGGFDGRGLTITNVGNYLIILENESQNSQSQNTFRFKNKTSYFLYQNSSIFFIYISSINRWVQSNDSNNNPITIYDDYFKSFTADIIPTSLISGGSPFLIPYPTESTLVFSGSNQIATASQTFGFRSYSGLSTGAIELYKCVTNSSTNRPQSIGIGPYKFGKKFEEFTGMSLCVISKFTSIKEVSPFLGPLDNWAVVLGTENSDLTINYSAATSNNTTEPKLSGGVFWLFDYSGNPNYARCIVQDVTSSSIVKNSTFNLMDITGTTFKTFGIYSTTQSGSSYGTSTFFWCINSGISENYKIEEPIFKTGGTINGAPSLNFYGGYNYSCNGTLQSASKLVVDNFGYNYKKI